MIRSPIIPGNSNVIGIKTDPKWNNGRNADADAPIDEIDMAYRCLLRDFPAINSSMNSKP